MEKELKIETAKSKCPQTNKENEFEEFLQTKRKNVITETVDIDYSENK